MDKGYMKSIIGSLKSVKRPGYFACGSEVQLPLPGLKVDGVDGFVGLPVCDAQARAIIERCSQAPYGRGEETIVDTSVRNTWQLDPSMFSISHPEWSAQLKELAGVVRKELGCDESLEVCCQLYKLLLYERGSFFKVIHKTLRVK